MFKQSGFWGWMMLIALGAILYDAFTHPKGVNAVAKGATSFVGTSLKYASGR